MIYSKTGEYAIRAILYLARQPQDGLTMSSEIAESEEIPAHYLAKILQRLAKYGFVDSYKGRGGGFRITEQAQKSSILEIVERIEGPVINERCVTGLKECVEENPCPLYEDWAKLRESIHQLISSQTVQAVADKYAETLKRNKKK